MLIKHQTGRDLKTLWIQYNASMDVTMCGYRGVNASSGLFTRPQMGVIRPLEKIHIILI